jgi:hypothetical protein
MDGTVGGGMDGTVGGEMDGTAGGEMDGGSAGGAGTSTGVMPGPPALCPRCGRGSASPGAAALRASIDGAMGWTGRPTPL